MNEPSHLSTEIQPPPKMKIDTSHPGTAAVLSAVLPGLGQIFNGHFFWAIFWFVVTPGLWIGSLAAAGFFGFVGHFLSSWQAYRQARRKMLS